MHGLLLLLPLLLGRTLPHLLLLLLTCCSEQRC
jgi:hypothetical protein